MPIIELGIEVSDIEQVVTLYDRLQFFKSPDQSGSPSPYVAITDIEPTSALLDGSISGPWNLNGQSLSIIVDGADPVVVNFTDTNPFNISETINNINSAFPEMVLASEVPTDTNKIRLTSPTSGTQSIIQVSGTAVATLGLSIARVNGKSPSPLLSANTEFYSLTDFDGQPNHWYKARYLNSITGAVSEFSEPFLGAGGLGLPTSSLVTGKIAMADISGNPIVGRRIIFVPTSSQVIDDGSGNFYGVLPSVNRIVVVTDDNGRASIPLVKGQRVKVFLEGTSFQREFTVPNTDFDVMTVASSQPDPLSIVTVPPFMVRVS